jgi:hypothetical protein
MIPGVVPNPWASAGRIGAIMNAWAKIRNAAAVSSASNPRGGACCTD